MTSDEGNRLSAYMPKLEYVKLNQQPGATRVSVRGLLHAAWGGSCGAVNPLRETWLTMFVLFSL